jgi:hypothetical protein
MSKLYTAAEAAKAIDRSVRGVQRFAKRLGLGRFGKAFALTEDDLEVLRDAIPGTVGNPSFKPKSDPPPKKKRRKSLGK